MIPEREDRLEDFSAELPSDRIFLGEEANPPTDERPDFGSAIPEG